MRCNLHCDFGFSQIDPDFHLHFIFLSFVLLPFTEMVYVVLTDLPA